MPVRRLGGPDGRIYHIPYEGQWTDAQLRQAEEAIRAGRVQPETSPSSPRVEAPRGMILDPIPEVKRTIVTALPKGYGMRAAAYWLVPGSLTELAVMVALGGPWGRAAGVLPGLARLALATGAGTTAGALTGRPVGQAVAEAGLLAAGGEAAGAVSRAGARGLVAAVGKVKDLPAVADAIGRLKPLFRGQTPEETMSNLVSGEGAVRLSKEYETGRGQLIKQYGDPPVAAPALEAAGGQPIAGPFSEVSREISSLQRSLHTQLGDMSRRAQALRQLDALDVAEEQVRQHLARSWRPEALAKLDALSTEYRRGKELIRLIGAGRDRPTLAQAKKVLIPEGGHLDMPHLQTLYQTRRGRLASVFDQDEVQLLDRAFRFEPLKTDAPGQLGVGMHVGRFGPHVFTKIPRVPRRTGGAEETAALLSQLGKLPGVRLSGAVGEAVRSHEESP